MAQGIDAAVLARRQKDVENFIDLYQQRLDGMVGDRIKDLAPAWQRMTKQLQARVTELYKELGALEDPTKIRALSERAGRLENLAAQLADDLTRLETTYQPYYTGNLLNQFEDSYYFHAYGLEQAARVSIQAPLLTKSTVLGVLANPWLPDGANYSSRLRANTAQLAGKVRGVVANAAMQGWSINEAARQLQAVTNEGFYNAARIMRTELNRAAALGSSYLYMENADVLDGKRWNATLDSRTAPKDAANDGNTYDLDYDTPGNPAIPGQRIPNHPHCRCKYSPILSALGISTKERIAREKGDSAQKFGGRAYTEARTYEEYAQEKGFPLPADRKDYAKSYLRPGETVADINKNVVRWQTSGGTISVPKAEWDVAKKPQPKNPVPKVPPTVPTPAPEPKQAGYQEAKTVKEATDWAMNNLGIDLVDYKGFDVRLANEINKTLDTLKRDFPEGASGIKWLGTGQQRNKNRLGDKIKDSEVGDKKTWIANKIKTYEDFLRKQGADDAVIADRKPGILAQVEKDYERAYAMYKKALTPKRIPGNVYAQATNRTWGAQQGISFNEKFSKDFDGMARSVAHDVSTKFHPVGCDTPASILTHEYGHQLDYFLKNADQTLRNWVIQQPYGEAWAKWRVNGIKENLSMYASENDGEFFAEAFAEYVHNPNPRPTAAEVGRRLEEALKQIRERGATK